MWFRPVNSRCYFVIKFNFRFKSSLSIVFYGSDNFSLPSLQAIYNNLSSTNDRLINRLEVVTKCHRNIVGKFSANKGLTIHQWPYILEPNYYDLGVVVSFGQLIEAQSIVNCKYGMINIHPSLLPKYRGSTPIPKAILNGDKETGLSIVTIEPNRFDVGKILYQERIPLSEEIKAIDLYHDLAQRGSTLLIKILNNIEGYLSSAVPQSSIGVSYAKKIKKSDGYINWKLMTSVQVDRLFRAYDGFAPIYCDWINGLPLHLYNMVDYQTTIKLKWDSFERNQFGDMIHQPGLIMYNPRLAAICFKCKDNQWICFNEVALKTYEKMTALEFKNGFISKYDQPLILSSNKLVND